MKVALRQKVHSNDRQSKSVALFGRAEDSERVQTLEEDRWYGPDELDLEFGGELMQEAAQELRERKRFLDDQLDEVDVRG